MSHSQHHEDEDDLQPTFHAGYKLGEKKTAEELAALDAEDESLAKWKASLGIGAGGAAHISSDGLQVRLHLKRSTSHRMGSTLLTDGCHASTDPAFYE